MKPPAASSPEALARMTRQRNRDTQPELRVRAALTALGFGYRLRNRDLPGTPDVANRKRKWVVFVHGCYWHHHEGCRRGTVPTRNRSWWLEKFEANQRRDQVKVDALRRAGFRVVVVWECETADEGRLRELLGWRIRGDREGEEGSGPPTKEVRG